MQEMTTHIVNCDAIAANHACHRMPATAVKRREAELTWATVGVLPPVLAQTWGKNRQVEAHMRVKEPLHVIKGSQFWPSIRGQPQCVFLSTERNESILDARE